MPTAVPSPGRPLPDFARLDSLERRFTGPVPRALRDAAGAAPEAVALRRAAARAAALAALAAEARADACALRAGRHLTAELRHRLARCGRRLAWARGRAEAWRRRAMAGRP